MVEAAKHPKAVVDSLKGSHWKTSIVPNELKQILHSSKQRSLLPEPKTIAVPNPIMADLADDTTMTQTAAILSRYGFELKGYTALELIDRWLRQYPAKWVRLAVVEALYLGRYKAISVEHILSIWLRRGEPTFHFSYDFERLVFRVLPPSSDSQPNTEAQPISAPQPIAESLPVTEEKENNFTQRIREISKKLTQFKPSIPKQNAKSDSIPIIPISQNRQSTSATTGETKNGATNRRGIHEFTPADDDSDFYSKLKAVAQQDVE